MGDGSGQTWPGCLPRYQVASVGKLWFNVGCYLAHYDAATTNRIVMSIGQNPCGDALLVAVYINTNLAATERNSCGEEIMVAIATAGLEYTSVQFLSHCKTWARDGRTWYMIRQWREVQSQMDYLLGTVHSLFWNVSVWDAWLNLDHFMDLGCLYRAAQRKHSSYLRWLQRFPLCSPWQQTQEDWWFYVLMQVIPKQPPRERRQNEWIYEET